MREKNSMKLFKKWLIVSLIIINNDLLAGDESAAATSKTKIKMGANILAKDVHTPSTSISPTDVELSIDDTYAKFAAMVRSTFGQTNLDSIVAQDGSLFLSEKCLKRAGKISEEHKKLLNPKESSSGELSYPIAHFSASSHDKK